MKYKLDISEFVYKKIKNRYKAAIAFAKVVYYCGRIQEADGNSKKLHNVIWLHTRISLPSHVNDQDLANEFLDFFIDKVVKLRQELDSVQNHSVMTCENVCYVSVKGMVPMSRFQLLTETEVQKIILGSKATLKLKEYLPHLLPVITSIINGSPESGTFPHIWKTAIVWPLLKKKGLPLDRKIIGQYQTCAFCPQFWR